MDRRHQVFVSSTFSDLKSERAEIIQALLELDCFPAGMELFPATSASAWDLIKGVIEDSDYYCLVIGGRYGSTDLDGISFTEKEYDYAKGVGKPIMAFLHKAPGSIPSGQTESSDAGRAKLDAFRAKVENAHHCKYWSSAEELGGQVSRSLVVLRRNSPADGWVQGKYAADDSLLVENATLRARVSQLEAQLVVSANREKTQPASDLARGTDVFMANTNFKLGASTEFVTALIPVTWDVILNYVGPSLLSECTQEELDQKLNLCLYHTIQQFPQWSTVAHDGIIIPIVVRDAIIVQLRALGQMAPGTKRRAVSNQKVYWRITEIGEARLLQTQAAKRKRVDEPAAATDGSSTPPTAPVSGNPWPVD